MSEWPGYDKRVATEWELVKEKSDNGQGVGPFRGWLESSQ